MESETSDNPPAVVDETSTGGGVLRIVLFYAVVAALWIVLSDAALGFLWDDPKAIALASTLKGWVFVAVTALLLFVLLRRQRALRQAVLQSQEQAEQLRLLQLIERQREERNALTSHYETLLKQARDIILLINADGEIVEANDAAVAAYGWSADELRSMKVRNLRADESQSTIERDWRASANPEGVLFEAVHRRKDGNTFPVEVSARNLEIQGKIYRQSVIRDISARRQTETHLRQQLDELRRWQEATLGREARILELKHEVNALLAQVGQPPRYTSAIPDDGENGRG